MGDSIIARYSVLCCRALKINLRNISLIGCFRVTSSVSWEQLSALSISGLVAGACVLTCAVCCCCRQRRRRQRRRSSYQQHDLYDDDDADLCACACCPSTSGLYTCKTVCFQLCIGGVLGKVSDW